MLPRKDYLIFGWALMRLTILLGGGKQFSMRDYQIIMYIASIRGIWSRFAKSNKGMKRIKREKKLTR